MPSIRPIVIAADKRAARAGRLAQISDVDEAAVNATRKRNRIDDM